MQPFAVLEVLILLLVANGAPIIIKRVLGQTWNWPIDSGLRLGDGEPLFGKSKTYRGILGSILVTSLAALVLHLHWYVGALVAVGAMAGDLLSSFVKRRLRLPSSSMAPGIDQVPEALLPLALVAESLDLTWADIIVGTALFWGGSLVLSRALYAVGIRDRPY
ncbi:MAG: CDP-archaeol synthase [Geminicoccaceae bacterium]